jgi:predicted nucleotidyltransferase
MADREIIKIVRRYLKLVEEEEHIPVSRGVIFGSCARGEESELSDIDVLVISPLFDRRKETGAVNRLWRLVWRVDTRIEPFAVGVQEFEQDDKSPIIGIARREGVKVEPAA